MKNISILFIAILFFSCAPNGTENDNIDYTNEKESYSNAESKTEKYYINKAYEAGALDHDSVGDYNTAILFLDSAITVNPKSTKAYRLKSFATRLLGEKEKALEIMNEAIKINSIEVENYFERAAILISLGKKEEGLKDFYTVIELNPKNGRAFEAVGYMEIEKGNKTKGCEFLNKARELGYMPENRKSDELLCK